MKALAAGVSALILFMAVLCMGAVAFLFGGDDATCTGTIGKEPGAAPSLNAPTTVRTRDLTWNAEQVHNAATIIGVGISMGVPVRGWIVAVAAAMQESNMVNLPDLGDANDADSLGLFQERPSQDWGTPDQITDPAYSSTKFFQHLLALPGWQTMTVAQAAQAVERSALPDAYATWEPDATQLVGAVGSSANRAMSIDLEHCPSNCPEILSKTAPSQASVGVVCDADGGFLTLPPGFGLPAGTPAWAATAVTWALGQLGTPYSFGGDCTAAHSGDPARECDCSSLVQVAYRAAGIDLPRTAAEQSRVGMLVSGPDQLRPGDLLFVPGSDGTASAPGHVGMYVGAGLVLDAPHTGSFVHLSAMSSYWLGGVVIRRMVGWE